MRKQAIFRADATTRMGTGHIMRCVALAQAWRDNGGEVTFLSRCENHALCQRIYKEGFGFVFVERPHPDPDDLQQALGLLRDNHGQGDTPCFVLDGYHFDPDYQKSIRSAGGKSLVIDDCHHLSHYHADILLNQNTYAPEIKYQTGPDTVLLLGTRYVLLRSEFSAYQDFERRIPERASRVLVTLGGADPDNATLTVLRGLAHADVPGLEARIVIGPANPHASILEDETAGLGFPAELLSSVEDMPGLMAWADIAVSAAGSTSWELCFMGVPFLAVVLADNQEGIAQGLDKRGAAVNLGRADSLGARDVARAVKGLCLDFVRRGEMSRNGRALVDGCGAERAVMHLRDEKFYLRPVRREDSKPLWQWANDPEVRRVSFRPGPISWEDHVKWFAGKLKDPGCRHYLALDSGDTPIGQIRFDVRGEDACVSVSVAGDKRGSGLGSRLVKEGTGRFVHETPIKHVSAFVKKENLVSVKTFQKAGFVKHGEQEVHGCPSVHMLYAETTRNH